MTSTLAVISTHDKTYATIVLVVLAVAEFLTAMYVYGRKGEKKHTKGMLLAHRIVGYVFLFAWLWPIFVGLELLHRLYGTGATKSFDSAWRDFDGPRFFHALLGMLLLILLVLKILFVRIYKNYRPSARLLGMLLFVGTLLIWAITGVFYLHSVGGPSIGR